MRILSVRTAARVVVSFAAAALLAIGLAPAPAQAQAQHHPDGDVETQAITHVWAHWKNSSSNTNGGVAETTTFHKNLVVEDFYSDGWGTRAQFQRLTRNSSGNAVWVDWGGVCFDDTSTGNSAGGRTVCERNPPAGSTMRIHVWASQSGTYRWDSYSPSIKF
ncbi:MAG TPA: hypothetical protein VFU12_14100 [Glycomyces sp.]|nr:hypothetical protein [Glycomyces sp.]